MQQWDNWLHEKKGGGGERGEEEQQEFVRRLSPGVEGRSRFLAQSHETCSREREVCREVEELEKDAKPMMRMLNPLEELEEECAKHWECNSEVQSMEDKPWRNEELRSVKDWQPRLEKESLEKTARSYNAATFLGCDGFHPKSKGELVKFFKKVYQCGRWPRQACTTMIC